MPFIYRRSHPSAALDLHSMLRDGASHTYKTRRSVYAFTATGSAAVTVDVESRLLTQLLEWKDLPRNSLRVQVLEVQDWEKLVEKIVALEAATGLLNELTADQVRTFEAAVKRRPLFG